METDEDLFKITPETLTNKILRLNESSNGENIVYKGVSIERTMICSVILSVFVLGAVLKGVFRGVLEEDLTESQLTSPDTLTALKETSVTSIASFLEVSEGEIQRLHRAGVTTLGDCLVQSLEDVVANGVPGPLMRRLCKSLGVYEVKVGEPFGGEEKEGGGGGGGGGEENSSLSRLTAALASVATENQTLKAELQELREELRTAKVQAETERLQWVSQMELLEQRVEGIKRGKRHAPQRL